MRKQKRKPAEAAAPPDAQLANRRFELVDTERAGVKAHRVSIISRVQLMHRQGKLSRDEMTACEYFEETYMRAGGTRFQTVDLDRIPGADMSDGQAFAQTMLAGLRRAIGLPAYNWLVWVAVENEAIRPMCRRASCRNIEGLPRFRMSVRRMARHWGLPMALDNGNA